MAKKSKSAGVNIKNAELQLMRPEVLKEPLLPLFEAVHNAIHASEEKNLTEILIEIEIFRKEDALYDEVSEITGFSVTDYGIGFTGEKTKAFFELFTANKQKNFNSKGIGRLSFFSAFEDISIESYYFEDNTFWEKKFSITLDTFETDDLPEGTQTTSQLNKTTVKIQDLREMFFNKYKFLSDKIVTDLKDYFAAAVLSSKSLTLKITDCGITKEIKKNTYVSTKGRKITIKNEQFQLYHIKDTRPKKDSHEIILVAAGRTVGKAERIKFLPTSKLEVGADEKFYLKTYVLSDFLDSTVDSTRSRFNISVVDEISLEVIFEEVKNEIRKYIKQIVPDIEERNSETIKSVLEDLPHLSIVADEKKILNELPLHSTAENIRSVLVQEYAKQQVSSLNYVKRKAEEYSENGPPNFEDFLQKETGKLQNASKLNHAPLITYVKYREFIINLFSQFLKKDDKGKYAYEAVMHNLIFPQKSSSDDAQSDYFNHNLWLVDDRYSAYQFIDSDIGTSKISGKKQKKNNNRYDVVASFSEATNSYNNIFIIELKREHLELSKDNDPIIQIRDYVKEIKAGSIDKYDGTRIQVNSATIYQGLVLCDTHHDYFKNSMIQDHSLKERADGKSYHTVLLNDSFFLEVMNYANLIDIAKIRNNAFMKKLKGE